MACYHTTMIISASYKTDIPAFYGKWFMNRLRAGYCMIVNPYGKQVYRVNLEKSAVDGFVFWTKNLGPFQDCLVALHQQGYPFVVQYTINGYSRVLESSVVDASRSAQHMKALASKYGPEVAVWRYDTVVFSSLTPADFHRRNFEVLAKSLAGTTNEVVLSFAQFYKKTVRNMNAAAEQYGFSWYDPGDEEKRLLLADLAEIAKGYKMRPAICGQRQFLIEGVSDARCIDAIRLSRVAGRLVSAQHKAQRPGCGCFAAKDIGEYDTCLHGCVYCYAVGNHDLARGRFRQHDPAGEFLFLPDRDDLVERASDLRKRTTQDGLFEDM